MNAGNRRIEIISILTARRHTTAHELAREFGVSVRTIQYDVQALSRAYPIYTKQGEHGGIFIRDDFKPYVNSLSELELKTLCDLLKQTEGKQKKILLQIIRKYGPDKLKI